MKTPLFHPGDVRRIVIFRALQLGDMLCAVPALRMLRRAYPDAHIALAGLPWAERFVERYHRVVNDFIVFPGAIGFPEQEETNNGLEDFYRLIRSRSFDLAIQLHGSGGVANDIVGAFGARFQAGFLQPGEPARAGCFVAWPDTLPEPLRYTTLMERLGLGHVDLALDIPLASRDVEESATLIEAMGIECSRLVIVHPGSQLTSRRWPAERFAQVADKLAEAGWQIAITGTHGERELTATVLGGMTRSALHLAGLTSLGGLAALTAQARLVIANDTGISHVAAAMRTPSVIVASGSDTRRWAPLDRQRHHVLASWPPCRPCSFAVCPYSHECALDITVNQVATTCFEQLEHGGPLGKAELNETGHRPECEAGATSFKREADLPSITGLRRLLRAG
jgi:ADP-heptose:LPS heptosyltransferase